MGLWDAAASLVSGGLSAFGSSKDRESQERIAAQNIAAQREFAQHGVRWKVADAQAAGIHPLAALGASTASFSPVSVGGDAGGAYKEMGQGIERAVKAAMQKEERDDREERKARELQMENQGLQNDILRAKLASDRAVSGAASGMIGPPLQLPGARVPLPRPGPYRTVEGEAVDEKKLDQTKVDVPSPQSGRPWGFELPYNPYFGSGQSFEDRYGDSELAQTLKFIVNTGADFGKYFWDSWKNPRTGEAARKRRHHRPWGE